MKVCILAGGLGTRLTEETQLKPKPMVEIGGWPMLWHIMNIYAAYGHREFILALGYKGNLIKDYFLNYYHQNNDVSIYLRSGRVKAHTEHKENWDIHCVDTGLNSGTGGRLRQLARWVNKGTFLMTYGDGVSNVDLKKLLAFHRRHRKLATMLAVRPPARFGSLVLKGDLVSSYLEKPHSAEGWINGGFFVLEPGIFDYIGGQETMFEQEPLARLAVDGQLAAYRHDDFWQCMDTLRDVRLLETLWDKGKAPWKVW